jgi:hypothetical protein
MNALTAACTSASASSSLLVRVHASVFSAWRLAQIASIAAAPITVASDIRTATSVRCARGTSAAWAPHGRGRLTRAG